MLPRVSKIPSNIPIIYITRWISYGRIPVNFCIHKKNLEKSLAKTRKILSVVLGKLAQVHLGTLRVRYLEVFGMSITQALMYDVRVMMLAGTYAAMGILGSQGQSLVDTEGPCGISSLSSISSFFFLLFFLLFPLLFFYFFFKCLVLLLGKEY